MKTARTTDPTNDICALLRERLRAAKRRNHRYSLRSFAKQLGIDHSTLSQVLRNRRQFSQRDLKSVARAMGLTETAVQNYSGNFRGSEKKRPGKIHSLQFDLDTFQLLSTWHHYAILEMTHIRGFKPDVRWIAAVLGIEVDAVNTALQRLLRLGLLEMSQQRLWVDKSGDAEFQTPALSEAASNQVQREIHELAIHAIERAANERRMQQHMVMAFDSAALPRLRRLAEVFMKKARALASDSDAKDDVYQLEVSFFPVTAKNNTGEKNG